MKIIFITIFIIAAAAAAAFFALTAIKRSKTFIRKAIVCCCILAVSAAGFALSSEAVPDNRTSEVHVTVSPVKDAPAPVSSIDPTTAPSAPVQAQGTYTASSRSDKFHLPSCSSASRISDANRIWFQTRDEALAAGYSPCGKCDP